jgi:hypothetical protein
MTIQQIITSINKEWNSKSMVELTIEVEGILDLRLQGNNPTFKDIINNTNHILAQLIAQREIKLNPIICCVYAAIGLRVLSLYLRPNQESGWPSMGDSVETLPWSGEPTKEKVLSMFLKSIEEDFNIEILSQNIPELIVFNSKMFCRYENDQLIGKAHSARIIKIELKNNKSDIVVEIEPNLSPKKGSLIKITNDLMVFQGENPDYNFTVHFDANKSIIEFILDMPNQRKRINYL